MFIIMKEKHIINEIVVAYKLVMQKKIQNFLEYCEFSLEKAYGMVDRLT